MSNLIQRLRTQQQWDPTPYLGLKALLDEAADEIERLTQEVKTLQEQLAAEQSKEVCTVAHDDPYRECPWCERDRYKAALEEIQELAGSHTVVRLETWETPPDDGGFAHLHRIAKQALESGDE